MIDQHHPHRSDLRPILLSHLLGGQPSDKPVVQNFPDDTVGTLKKKLASQHKFFWSNASEVLTGTDAVEKLLSLRFINPGWNNFFHRKAILL